MIGRRGQKLTISAPAAGQLCRCSFGYRPFSTPKPGASMTTLTSDVGTEPPNGAVSVVTGAPAGVPPEVAVAPARRRLGRTYWSIWSAASVSSLGDGLAVVGFP